MTSSNQPRNILLFGATGAIGPYLTSALLDNRMHFGRIAIFTSASTLRRKPEEIQAYKSRGADIITGDLFSEADVKRAYEGGVIVSENEAIPLSDRITGFDTVVSALGRSALAHQTTLIRLAEECDSIQFFYPSEYGTDIKYSEASTHEPVHQGKLVVRKFLREQTKRLQYTFVVTGPYADYLLLPFSGASEVGGFDIEARKAWLLGPTGDEPIAFTHRRDVGKILIASLLHPAESRNRALRVFSFVATQHEILAEIERQTNTTPRDWTVENVGIPKLDYFLAHDPAPELSATAQLRRLWIRGDTLYTKYDNDLVDAPQMCTLDEAVAEAVAAACS